MAHGPAYPGRHRALDARLEDEDLDGQVEAVEVREALERVQSLSLEVSEEVDAYQDRHAP